MAADLKTDRDEWRLGIEPGERHESSAPRIPANARRDPAYERLERPVMLITVERLYWAIIATYTVVSRCALLGARPLASSEARQALAAYETIHLGAIPGPPAAWLQLLNAAMLGAFGASDVATRLLAALSGIALVLIALAFRRSIGRAGALAMATMVALSPSITYFSRSAVTQGPALLAALAVMALFAANGRRATPGRIIALGCAIGLALSADAQNLVVGAAFALGLAMLGIWRLAAGGKGWLRMRIWWQQHSAMVLLATVLAIAIWAAALCGFFTRPFLPALAAALRSNWAAPAASDAGLGLCLASLTFYEFLIVIAALIGALAVLSNLAGVRSALAGFVLIWTVAAAAFFMMTPAFSAAWIIEILIPAGALGGIGIEALSRTRGWSVVFYPFAALALATLYIQIATNFVIVAPDPTEAPWARHALLFWSEATTANGVREAIQQMVAAGPSPVRSAWIVDDAPVLHWYLRDLSPAETPAGADLIASANQAPAGWPIGARISFDLESWWHPDFRSLSARRAIRFILIARGWQRLESREVTILTRAARTPTTIYAPAPPASAATNTSGLTSIAQGSASASTASVAASPQPTP